MPEEATTFENLLGDLPFGRIGEVRDNAQVQIYGNSSSSPLIDADIYKLKEAWQATLRF
jgi:hypothetical protein